MYAGMEKKRVGSKKQFDEKLVLEIELDFGRMFGLTPIT